MVVWPEVQSESEAASEQEDCILRVTEAEFLLLMNNLAAAVQQQTTRRL